MHAHLVLSIFAIAVSALPNPATLAKEAENVCVLIDGNDPYVLDPFDRPQCACDCIKEACKQVSLAISTHQ